MTDDTEHKKLVRAMARLVACKEQLHEHRGKLQQHASEHLDTSNKAVRIASEHLRDHPNVLTHRYVKARMAENQQLRGMALRAETDRAGDR